MELDHVLIAVADLAAAGRDLELRHGLESVEGGRHVAWGTANRIVPLGDSYLELVAVVDQPTAAESAFGRWVESRASAGGPLGWAVRTSHLDEVARRLDLAVEAGSRVTPRGHRLRWRSAGLECAVAEPSLPFFIEWAPRTKLPGRATAHHRAGTPRITKLFLDANAPRLAGWLGDHHLPLVVRSGMPAVKAICISTDRGEVVVGSVAD